MARGKNATCHKIRGSPSPVFLLNLRYYTIIMWHFQFQTVFKTNNTNDIHVSNAMKYHHIIMVAFSNETSALNSQYHTHL